MKALMVALIGSLGIAGFVQSQDTKTSSEEKQVRATVQLHFEGIRTADRALLEKAWDSSHGHLKSVHNTKAGEEIRVDSMKIAFDRWTKKKAPKAEGKILKVDLVEDRMAMVKIEFKWQGATYLEYLTLYKLNGAWKIVNKTYVTKSAGLGGSPY